MKLHSRLGTSCFALLLILSVSFSPAMALTPMPTPDALTILFTHDTHDHFLPDASDRGGYTRLAALLKEQRQAAGQCAVITLDAGDFSMGSLFQTVYPSDAPELRALGAMGYDVATLGNHEFDYRQQGLADMLNAAKKSGDPLPALVQANYTSPVDPSEAAPLLEAFENYPVTPYTILEKPEYQGAHGPEGANPLRIAVFGVMGLDSHECAPMSDMVYEPIIDAARRVVAEIREKENPDYIICLSHSGTEDGKGEDYELAKAVDGIDVIISGHTHTTLPEPIEVNQTLIVSCGPYTQNLGVLTVHRSGGDGSIQLGSYQLIPIDNSLPADPDMTAMAEEFKGAVEQNYLSRYRLGYDEVLARSETDFTTAETGDLIGQAYLSTIRDIEGASYVPIAFAVAPDGVIRDRVRSGDVTTADAFDILSLGSGADGTPGYPLVSVYLTGKDLKNAFEVDASVSDLMPAAELFGAGCAWTYNPHRMFLDRVTECTLRDPETGQQTGIQDDQLYRVVADLYSGQMLGTVESKSFGLLTVTPRDENGTPVTDLESRILHDRDGSEVKAWYALASHLKKQAQIRPPFPSKEENASWNPIHLLFPMGLPTLVLLLAGLVLIVLVLLVVRLIRRRRDKGSYRPYRG